MSLFSTAKKLINIADWFVGIYANVKKKIKKWKRKRIAKSIRSAIDRNNKSVVAKRVRHIIKKRKDRADSS